MTLIIVLSLPSRCADFFFLVFIFIIALDAFMQSGAAEEFCRGPCRLDTIGTTLKFS